MTSQAIKSMSRLAIQSPRQDFAKADALPQADAELPDTFDVSNAALQRIELPGIAGLSAPAMQRDRWEGKLPFDKQEHGKTLVYTDIPDDARLVHQNLLGYFKHAWSEHFGAALTPEMLWQHVQSEVARAVGDDPDVFRRLFATSQNKETVRVVHRAGPGELFDALADAVGQRLPDSEFVTEFTPAFSTGNKRAHTALRAALLGSLSSYYEYEGTMCGIPYVQIFGNAADWRLFSDNARHLSSRFGALMPAADDEQTRKVKRVADYMNRVSNLAGCLERPENLSGKRMFVLNCCESGDHEPYGWILEAFLDAEEITLSPYVRSHLAAAFDRGDRTYTPIKQTRGWEQVTPESGVALFEYKRDLGDRHATFEVRSGLFYSHAVPQPEHPQHPILQPQFGVMIYEKTAKQSVSDEKRTIRPNRDG